MHKYKRVRKSSRYIRYENTGNGYYKNLINSPLFLNPLLLGFHVDLNKYTKHYAPLL